MRIGIDAHILGKQKGGVETHVYNIIRTLAELDTRNEYFLYVTSGHTLAGLNLPSNFHLRPLVVDTPWLQRPFLLPWYYWKDRLDLIHVQRVLPFWGCRRTVLSIHDAIYCTHPDLFPAIKRIVGNAMIRWSARRASVVLTVSRGSAREIAHWYQVPLETIECLPNGIDARCFSRETDPGRILTVTRQHRLTKPYVLYLGAVDRHKSVHVLLEAFRIFKMSQPGFQLCIAGKIREESKGGYSSDLLDLSRTLGIGGDTVFTGHVSDEARRVLLSGAAMVVFPSAAEGFGLPPLEAMACGVPVVTAQALSVKKFTVMRP